MNVYPWQLPQWERLTGVHAQERMPHALLLAGAAGLGLDYFAECLAARVLCESPAAPPAAACGQCRSCTLFRAGTHPDFVRLEPDPDSVQIKVDAIRELIGFLQLSGQYGRAKVALVYPADAMNRNAANGLLKILEEPPPTSLLMLCSPRPGRLPVTIRSRCHRVEFAQATGPEAISWLESRQSSLPVPAAELLRIAGGEPLTALELAASDDLAHREALLADLVRLRRERADPVATARQWLESDAANVLGWVLGFLADLLRRKLAGSGYESDKSSTNKHLQQLADELDLSGLMACYDAVLQRYRDATGPISLSEQSLLEDVIIRWQMLEEQR
jgi:DNA polymerase-3 subunit delta'